ncbi:hypothetical protein [Herbaspirillum sp. YR522]|uniref:hypothetical protein n=1 Tax=Herbaspirillum sp. YR522 TaxID=1144342 RepID=UPI0012FB60E7|nr:hypothetical protein [Herbaspirillum sp. YR522]
MLVELPRGFFRPNCHWIDSCLTQVFERIDMTSPFSVGQSSAALPIDEHLPARQTSTPSAGGAAPPAETHPRQVEGRRNFLARVFKSDQSGTLIVGCGREGTKWNTPDANKKHQHAKEGAVTMDIEAGNNPDFVADITSRNLPAAMAADANGFDKIKFEKISAAVISAENSGAVVDNIVALSKDKVKVSLTTGEENDLTPFASALREKGFQVKQAGQGQLKATKG